MTKMKKKIYSLLLGVLAFFALILGVAFSVPEKKASAETTVDLAETMVVSEAAKYGDYKYAHMIRLQFPSNGVSWGAKCLNDSAPEFLKYIMINGESVYDRRTEYAALIQSGAASPITWEGYPDNGAAYPHNMQPNIRDDVMRNRALYAPIFVNLTHHSSLYSGAGGNAIDIYIPGSYLANTDVISFGISKEFSWTADNGTVYNFSKDLEFVRSGGSFVKVDSSVDISDAFKLLVQDYTSSNGTMLYYLHTNNTQYWTQQYGTANAYAINESEWKGVADTSLQGGAVQMSYLEVNGRSIYDINATDNGAYGATQGNIASGGKYAPILAFLTPQEVGNAIKLQIPSAYPSGSGTAVDNHKTIAIKRGFYVVDTSTNIKYEVTRDIQWDYVNGNWIEHVEKIETSVADAKIFVGSTANDTFAGIKLEGSDYANAPGTYVGDKKTALSFAQSANFKSHVLINDQPLATPGEAFLNVWGNYGYFTFRPGNDSVTKITVLAGCEIPTYYALKTGTKEVYVVKEDVTFVKDASGNWVKDEGVKPGEYNTSVERITYARDKANNWMMFKLSDKDYPKAGETYNVADTENKISALNLYDKIIVDGYTLRSRINQLIANGQTIDHNDFARINLWQADCLGIRVPGAAGTLDGAKKVTIRIGAQFPSYAYIKEGIEAFYVTTEEITFVNVGADNGIWERQYTATFVADGDVVATKSYVVSQGLTDIPDVPEKEGYKGAWEAYTANGNITVNAVYTKKATVLGSTGLKEIRRIDNNSNLLIINPANSDYPASVDGSWNLGLDVSHLQKFNTLDYITINGTTLRELGVSSMAINKFTRAGLGLETKLSDNMTIVIKKGCEIPSYAFWQNPNGEASAYVMDADYICVYSAGGETAFTITVENADVETSNDFDGLPTYILSDLNKEGYNKTEVFKDGFQTLTKTDGGEADYYYGYVNPNGFMLSFDFKYEGNPNFYETFVVSLGTEGYGGHKAHFGWRFFLIRGSEGSITKDMCVQHFSMTREGKTDDNGGNLEPTLTFGSAPFESGQVYHVTIGYKLVNAETGTVKVYTAINDYFEEVEYTLGGEFIKFAPYANSLTMNVEANSDTFVTVSNPGMGMTQPSTLTLQNGNKVVESVPTSSYVLPALNPAECGMGGNVFVGWTSNVSSFPDLYPAGYEYSVNSNVTLHAVWIQFSMRDGAGVRLTNGSGLRFLVDVDKPYYEAGKQLNYMTEIGTIIAPTSYLTGRELSHEQLGEGYYLDIPTADDKWQVGGWYSSAMLNISPDQYARSFSARGYIKMQYTSGAGYIYTEYNAAKHARSIYQVANMAFSDYEEGSEAKGTISSYVDAIADITIDGNLNASKTNGANGGYNVSQSGTTFAITDGNVKGVMVNGVRIIMGYDATIVIDGVSYTLKNYKLNTNGAGFAFTLVQIGDDADTSREDYYFALLQAYLDRNDYTKEHKAEVNRVANDAIGEIGGAEGWVAIVEEALNTLASIKTAAQLAANDTGNTTLAVPVVRKGLGYTVTWDPVDNADYYIVHDDNDYREYTVVMTNSYKAEVIGKHNVTVSAHSYYVAYNSSAESGAVATTEVKPAFSYKSMLDGLYKFTSSQWSTMGIRDDIKNKCYVDDKGTKNNTDDDEYFVYYNVKTKGWTPYKALATDWTSPEEFPAHAQRLKDMGNNVILLARDTNAEYKAGDVWESSRLKYVMDTAWSMGMKVLVCDEVFYKLSMSDNSGTGATSKAQVTTAINNREGFADYVTHPAFYGFSLDDEPYAEWIECLSYTISALDDACEGLGVSDPFYLSCLFQYQGGHVDGFNDTIYLTKGSLQSYWKKWLAIEGVDSKYLYVDIYTQHAMDQPTNRYNDSFDVVYNDSYLGGKYDFYQAITAHTQNDGVLLAQDMYMSLLYAAAHDVAGYSWFCYFPITLETNGSIGGYDGNGYGNGIGNGAKKDVDYYAAAKTAAYQFELIQGWLDGYDWKTRSHNDSKNLLTTTLSNGTNTATMYVNADVDGMSGSVTVTAISGKTCYLVGYGIDTYQIKPAGSSVTLVPGQALLCI